jgi:hypothetical protein
VRKIGWEDEREIRRKVAVVSSVWLSNTDMCDV